MKCCNKCKVNVNSSSNHCPLCFSDLKVVGESRYLEMYPNLDNLSKQKSKNSFLIRCFLFLSVAAIIICVVINIFRWQGLLWSLIVTLGIFIIWEVIGFLTLSKKNFGFRILFNMIIWQVVLITIDIVTGWHQWSINLVTPIIIIASTLTITIILFKERHKWREYMIYQFFITINGLIPLILYACGVAQIYWLVTASLLYSLITMTGMWTFADKQLLNELKKRFHI